MKPGREAIERAKQSGRRQRAYDSPSRAIVPPDLQVQLEAHPRTKAFFAQLHGVNRYAILFRLQSVRKPDTRMRKIRQFVEMLEKHETIHPSHRQRPTR